MVHIHPTDTESDNMAIGYNAMTTNTAGGSENIAIGNFCHAMQIHIWR